MAVKICSEGDNQDTKKRFQRTWIGLGSLRDGGGEGTENIVQWPKTMSSKRQARETLRGKDQRAQERTTAQGLHCFALLVPAPTSTGHRAITAFLCASRPCSPESKQHFVLWSGRFWNRVTYSKWPTPSFPEKLLLTRFVCAFYKMDGISCLQSTFLHTQYNGPGFRTGGGGEGK